MGSAVFNSVVTVPGVRSEPLSTGQAVSRPQDSVLWHWSIPILRHVWTRHQRVPHGWLLLQGQTTFVMQLVTAFCSSSLSYWCHSLLQCDILDLCSYLLVLLVQFGDLECSWKKPQLWQGCSIQPDWSLMHFYRILPGQCSLDATFSVTYACLYRFWCFVSTKGLDTEFTTLKLFS